MTSNQTFKTTIKSEDDICDICGSSLLESPKVNEPKNRPPISNKSPTSKAKCDIKLSSYKCISCKKPLKIPLNGFELNQKINDLLDLNNLLEKNLKNFQDYSEVIRSQISTLLKGKLNHEEPCKDGKTCISLIKKTFESLETKPMNQRNNYMDGEEYINSYFSDIKIQVIKHQLTESNNLYIKSNELISKIEKQEKMCLSNVDQVKDTNKSYYNNKFETFKASEPAPSEEELKKFLIKINTINLYNYRHDLRMQNSTRFVSSNDLNIFGKIRRKQTSRFIRMDCHFEGDQIDGIEHGYGIKRWLNDGTVYDGDFIDGKLHGTGTVYWCDGSKYVGELRENHLKGQGLLYLNDKLIYKGNFMNDKRHGAGCCYDDQGNQIKGIWNNGKMIFCKGKSSSLTDVSSLSSKLEK